MYDFNFVRRRIIDKMAALNMSPIDKVAIAKEYHVEEWLGPGLEELVKRAQPMTIEDANRIGIDYALKIAAIRECYSIGYYGDWVSREERGVVVFDCRGRVRTSFGLQ